MSNEHYEAKEAASDVRAFLASYGAECEVLPAGDRVVIHMPLQSVTDLVTASHIRGHILSRRRDTLNSV